MQIQTRKNGSAVAVLDLEGRLVFGAPTTRLRREVDALIEQRFPRIVLNMRGGDRVDCAGIGQLVKCHSKARQHGGCLKLAQLNQRLQDLFTLFHLESVLETFESERSAVRSLVALPTQESARRRTRVRPRVPRPSVLAPVAQPQRYV